MKSKQSMFQAAPGASQSRPKGSLGPAQQITEILRLHFIVICAGCRAGMEFVVAQNVGACSMECVKQDARSGLMIGGVLSLASAVLMLVFGRYPMRLFTSDGAAIEMAMKMLSILAPFWIGMAAQLNMAAVLRAMGEGLVPMPVSLVELFCFRIPAAYLLTNLTGDPFICWWTMALNWFLSGALSLWYYVSSR